MLEKGGVGAVVGRAAMGRVFYFLLKWSHEVVVRISQPWMSAPPRSTASAVTEGGPCLLALSACPCLSLTVSLAGPQQTPAQGADGGCNG